MEYSKKIFTLIIFSFFLFNFLIASENNYENIRINSVESNYSEGLKYYLLKDYAASIPFLDDVYLKNPSYKKIKKIYADSLEKLGEKAFSDQDYQLAETVYAILVKKFPNEIYFLKYYIILSSTDLDLFESTINNVKRYKLDSVDEKKLKELLDSVPQNNRMYYKQILSKGEFEKKLVYNYLEGIHSKSGLSIFQSIMLLILFFILLYISIILFSFLLKLKDFVNSREIKKDEKNVLPHFHRFDLIKKRRKSRFQKFLTMKKAYKIAMAVDRFTGSNRQNIETGNLVYRIVERADFLNSIDPIAAQKAGYIHNIGLIRVSKLMRKKGYKLGDATIEQYRGHIIHGTEMLKKHKPSKLFYNAIYYHHERYDGTGYPEGLKGRQIPVIARIIAAAVYFTGLTCDSDRKHALSEATAIMMLENYSGKHFDPKVVRIIKEIYQHDTGKLEK